MDKINLRNDYNHAAHPRVLEAISAASEKRFPGYGTDEECAVAAKIIRHLTGQADADVHFMVGGTQTNLTAIAAFLRPHEAVISMDSAHINIHETGAIEAAGHKILTIPDAGGAGSGTSDFKNTTGAGSNIEAVGKASTEGKADTESVRAIIESHTDEHMVKPKMLFISQATELGTVYTRAELHALRDVCDEYGLYLYIDGARLGCALTSESCDLTLQELASLADAFYIGGTKNGLLFGEALVIRNPALREDFRFLMKQRGGLLAKGFLLGIQFRALLEDGLYFELARQANEMAARLDAALRTHGIPMLTATVSNQVFPMVNKDQLRVIEEHFLFERWGGEAEQGTPIRFVTTWQTTDAEIQAISELFDKKGRTLRLIQ